MGKILTKSDADEFPSSGIAAYFTYKTVESFEFQINESISADDLDLHR
jgi:hypothetical protein